MSESGCNYKLRTGTTYRLKVEREGNVSDHSCNYKMRAGTTYCLEVETVTCQIAVVTTTRGQGQHTT
jgi:hypothetical protein